jgi:hypothetical protein
MRLDFTVGEIQRQGKEISDDITSEHDDRHAQNHTMDVLYGFVENKNEPPCVLNGSTSISTTQGGSP